MIKISSESSRASYNCCCPNGNELIDRGEKKILNDVNYRDNVKYERLKCKSLAFIGNLFKLRKRDTAAAVAANAEVITKTTTSSSYCSSTGMRIDEEITMQRSPRFENTALGGMLCSTRPRSAPAHQLHKNNNNNNNNNNDDDNDGTRVVVSRIPSTLSVTGVDVTVMTCGRQATTNVTTVTGNNSASSSNYNSRGASPSHSSILTLTPGRARNIDQELEALRLSRQDNPYLQVLASKESLIDSVEESESDDAILMSQEIAYTDPLTMAQVHEHLVRSPPPASWNRSPIFHFPHQQQQHKPQHSPGSKSDSGANYTRTNCLSPRSGPLQRPNDTTRDDQTKNEGSMEIRDRHSHTFSLLNPTPIRSFSEVRRMHRSEDSVQLMSSE